MAHEEKLGTGRRKTEVQYSLLMAGTELMAQGAESPATPRVWCTRYPKSISSLPDALCSGIVEFAVYGTKISLC